MTSNSRRKLVKCHHSGKLGPTKRNCRLLFSEDSKSKCHRHGKERANKATTSDVYSSDVDIDSDILVVCHALAASDTNKWI